MQLYIYMNYAGKCREAFPYYEQHLGGKITMMMTHGDGPNPNDGPPNWKDVILHARIDLGETALMAPPFPTPNPFAAPISL